MGPWGEGSVPAQLISRSIAYWSLRYHYPMQTLNYTLDMTWLTVTLPFVVNTPYIIQSLRSWFIIKWPGRFFSTFERTPLNGLTKFNYFDSNQKFTSATVTKCLKNTVWSPRMFRLRTEYIYSDEVLHTSVLLRRVRYPMLILFIVATCVKECIYMYLKFLNTHKSCWLWWLITKVFTTKNIKLCDTKYYYY